MPDYLSRGIPFKGDSEVTEDNADMVVESAWLASTLRMFTREAPEMAGVVAAQPKTYRLATAWWLVLLDTFLRTRTGAGLEAFSSHETAEAAKLFASKILKYLHMFITK